GIEPGNEPQNGGFVEVSGKKHLIFRGSVDLSAPNGSLGTLLLDPEDIIIQNSDTIGGEFFVPGPDDNQLTADIPVGNLEGEIFAEDGGPVTYTISRAALQDLPGTANLILEANNNITIEELVGFGTELTFQAGTGSVSFVADADGNGVGDFSMNTANTISARGRHLSISGANIVVGDINTGLGFGSSDGGAVTLNATNGSITGGTLYTGTNLQEGSGFLGNGGAVTVTATGDITLDTINTSSVFNADSLESGAGSGGPITLRSINGNITVQLLDSSASMNEVGTAGNGGEVLVEALNGSVDTNGIRSYAESVDGTAGTGGDVVVNAGTSLIIRNLLNSRSSEPNSGGNVELTGDQIELPPEGSGQSNNGGILLLQPSTPNTNIAINAEAEVPGSLSLTQAGLRNLNSGFDAVTFGRADGTGAVTLDSFDIPIDAPLTVRSPNGTININSPIEAIDLGSITLVGATTLNSTLTTVNQPIAIQGDVTLGLNPVTLTSGDGAITLTG
ncbi:MAG TPA: hypothetical protein V6D27_04660, partial [Vampirovibrionales bacterium]